MNQTGVNPSGGVPYPALFHEARIAWLARKSRNPLFLFCAMAVVVRESGANPMFCKCDELYGQNMRALTHWTGISELDWLKFITIAPPGDMVGIPKFRFEQSFYSDAKMRYNHCNYSRVEMAVFGCSFGYGQKSALYLTFDLPQAERIWTIKTFNRDRIKQLTQVLADVEELVSRSSGDWQLALTRYNRGPSFETVTEYGRSLWAKAQDLQQRIPNTLLEGF